MRRLAISENHDGSSPVIDARPANPIPASNLGLNDNSAKTYPRSFEYFFRRVVNYLIAREKFPIRWFLRGASAKRQGLRRIPTVWNNEEKKRPLSPVTYTLRSFPLLCRDRAKIIFRLPSNRLILDGKFVGYSTNILHLRLKKYLHDIRR